MFAFKFSAKPMAVSMAIVVLLCFVSTSLGLQPVFQRSTVVPRSHHLAGSPLFRRQQQRQTQTLPFSNNRRYSVRQDLAQEPTNGSSKDTKDKSVLTLLNELGQSFKPKAQRASELAAETEQKGSKILRIVQASCFYMLFMLYRAYRGFFVLTPAIFKNVYSKLMDTDVLVEVEKDDDDTTTTNGGKSRATQATVVVLASIVTASYLLGGFVRVVMKFIRTITKTSSVPQSFEAAADEMESHESKLDRISKDESSSSSKKNPPPNNPFNRNRGYP